MISRHPQPPAETRDRRGEEDRIEHVEPAGEAGHRQKLLRKSLRAWYNGKEPPVEGGSKEPAMRCDQFSRRRRIQSLLVTACCCCVIVGCSKHEEPVHIRTSTADTTSTHKPPRRKTASDAREHLQLVVESAREIENSSVKAVTLGELAFFQSQTSDQRSAAATFAESLQAVRSIPDGHHKASALCKIGAMQIRSGDVQASRTSFAEALSARLRTARTAAPETDEAEALCEIATAQSEAGDLQGARETANAIDTAVYLGLYRDEALGKLAVAQVKARDIAGAFETIRSIAIAPTSGPGAGDDYWGNPYWKVVGLREIARFQAREGDIVAALRTAHSIEQRYQHLKPAVLGEVACILLRGGHEQVARVTMAEALEIAHSIRSEVDKGDAFLAIARAQARIGDAEGALVTSNLLGGQNERLKAIIVHEVAAVQARSGNIAAAIETAHSIDSDDHFRADSLRAIAAAQGRLGDIGGALQTARSIERNFEKAVALSEIAVSQAISGDKKAGASTFGRALEVASLVDEARRPMVVSRIAANQAHADDVPTALVTAATIKNPAFKSRAYVAIGRAVLKYHGFIDEVDIE